MSEDRRNLSHLADDLILHCYEQAVINKALTAAVGDMFNSEVFLSICKKEILKRMKKDAKDESN